MEKRNTSKPELRSFLVPRDPSVDRRFRPRPDIKVNLCDLISEEDEDSCISGESTCTKSDISSGDAEGALVFLRMRPVANDKFCPSYKINGTTLITSQADNSTNSKGSNILERHFTFSNIFDGSVNQSIIYNNCIRGKIESAENMTVVTYGTSGSGKTFTLLGDLENPGIVPRALENLFTNYANNIYTQPSVKMINSTLTLVDDDSIKKEESMRNKIFSMCPDVNQIYNRIQKTISDEQSFNTMDISNKSVFIWISFAEIYKEIVHDLLNIKNGTSLNKSKSLKIISNDGKVFIKDLTSIHVKNGQEAYKLLTYGLKRLTYASTAINAHSSRSHCIFFVDVITYSYPDIFTHNSYKFCDLAGSERLGKTENVGTRLKEAQRINTSLMVFGRCLDTAYSNQQKKTADIIPYRESKLTLILQAALNGKETISMIVNITPTENYFEENLHVLKFSSIAKNIVYKPNIEKNSRTRYSWFVSHTLQTTSSSPVSSVNTNGNEFDSLYEENITLRSEIERLNTEILRLENQMVTQEFKLRNSLVDEFEQTLKQRNEKWEQRLAQEKQSIVQIYEAKMTSLEEHYKRKLENLEYQMEDMNMSTDKYDSSCPIMDKENIKTELETTPLKEIDMEEIINQSDSKKRKVVL